ncbi:hypothetical protein AURDEDRAFT_165591 [Auricularia subglabra TFB-10046 SS5]|nr:hypothetical protein AURDEDRAFT_165591 [Auricularia subglabra TFB-10046 SS5]
MKDQRNTPRLLITGDTRPWDWGGALFAELIMVSTPAHARFLALDDSRGALIAFDGAGGVIRYLEPAPKASRSQALETRQDVSCSPISEAEVRAPGSGTVDNEDTTSNSVSVPAACKLLLTNTTCTATGTANIRLEAGGWLWFNYPSQRNGHYKWAVSINALIPDVEKRTSYMSLDVSVTSSGLTAYTTHCPEIPASISSPNDGKMVPNSPAVDAPPQIISTAAPQTITNSHKHSIPVYGIVLITLSVVLVIAAPGCFIRVWCRTRQKRARMAARSTPEVLGPREATPVRVRPPPSLPVPADEKYRAWLAHIDAARYTARI